MVLFKNSEYVPLAEFQKEIDKLVIEKRAQALQGKIADYIPELSKANPKHISLSICLMSGEIIEAGDTNVLFTMQSISKVISLALVLIEHGKEAVFSKVGMEPTGDPFNSIVKLETITPNKPLNPMINAGAIAVTSMIKGTSSEERLESLLQFVRKLTNNQSITYNSKVAKSEADTANLNRALAYFMKEHEVIEGDIENHLDLYFKQCSIEVTSRDLAVIGAVLANEGKSVYTQEQLIPPDIARICKTFMVTCGMYNASGEFAIKVGFPAKSGVSGGILGCMPYHMGIGVYSPLLDDKGNSVVGVDLLEELSERWKLSIF